jgi:hypothetical protein
MVWSNISAIAQWTQRYMNNIYMVIQTDKPLYRIPTPAYPDLSDGNLWCRRKTNATASSVSHSGPGSLQMVGIADYHLVEQFIPVNPGQMYAIQGWIKTVNMGTKKAWVELRFFNASGGQVTYPWADYVTSPSAYTKVPPAGGTLTPVGSKNANAPFP